MSPHDAIDQACAAVGIKPPRAYQPGKWAKCDTIDGKSGKGDGRLIADDLRVTGWNWKTGEKATIWLKDRDSLTPVEKKQFAERRAKDEEQHRERAARAAHVAQALMGAAKLGTHPYLARKGFPEEPVHVLSASDVAAIGGDYLVKAGGERAIILPARIGQRVTSAQLIWEDGSKKFLAGGEMGNASHRIATGRLETWLCEGFATGLSLKAVLASLNKQVTILCCFSASNIATVARRVVGRCIVAADHDRPIEQLGGVGTGEHYAMAAGKPFIMPPSQGTDFNDMHMGEGIFAVQKHVKLFIRTAGR